MDYVNDEEKKLILELYKKDRTHTEIAICIQRERKVYKNPRIQMSDCLSDVEQIILDEYRRK